MSDCVHHRILESPNGPTTVVVCKLCGDVQEGLPNSNDHAYNPSKRKPGERHKQRTFSIGKNAQR